MIRKVVSWGVFLAVMAGAWVLVGPQQLGGPARYVIVDGTSMEPTYRHGDFVIARARDRYAVGDIITFSPDVGGNTDFPVIHRVVAVSPDGTYVTQGDNRADADGWPITDEDIAGASLLHVPRGGVLLRFLGRPATLGALAVFFVVMAILRRQEARTRSRELRSVAERDAQVWLDAVGADIPRPASSAASPAREAARPRRARGPLVAVSRVLLVIVVGGALTVAGVRGHAATLVVDGGVLQEFQQQVDPEIICGGPCS